jgi:hypothetical protein
MEIAPSLFHSTSDMGRQHRVAGGAERVVLRQRFLVIDIQRRNDLTGPHCRDESARTANAPSPWVPVHQHELESFEESASIRRRSKAPPPRRLTV